MASNNNYKVISKASTHTIKKFELIENYVKSWAQKLMLTDFCEGIIYIDCMCNSGIYTDYEGNVINGTAIRVANVLRDIAGQYPSKKVCLCFNDNDSNKISELRKHLPKNKSNFKIAVYNQDGNELLKEIGAKLDQNKKQNFFLLYDPYDASIDWAALAPFFRNWGEVLINHMISDPIRAISQVRSDKAKQKYMDTYLVDDVSKLIPFGSDKGAYEKRLEKIITALKGRPNRKYYIAAFPFFNSRNSLLYDLVHCTGHIKGYKLFKSTAWTTFGRKSSTKNKEYIGQYELTFKTGDELSYETHTDETCYFVQDIAKYVQKQFNGKQDVSYTDIWNLLDEHPIFPSDGYKQEIKEILVSEYGAIKKRSTISFKDWR